MSLETIFNLFDVILSDIYFGNFKLADKNHLELF